MDAALPELSPATRALWPKQEGGMARGGRGGPARTHSVARGGRTASETCSRVEAERGGRQSWGRRRVEVVPGAPSGRDGLNGERRKPWRGCPSLGGARATTATRGDHRRARARGRRSEACPAGLRLPTRSWGVCECWMVLEEAGGGSIYR